MVIPGEIREEQNNERILNDDENNRVEKKEIIENNEIKDEKKDENKENKKMLFEKKKEFTIGLDKNNLEGKPKLKSSSLSKINKLLGFDKDEIKSYIKFDELK